LRRAEKPGGILSAVPPGVTAV